MSPLKSYVAAITELLRQAGAEGAEFRCSTTAERGVAELVTPEGLIASTTVRVRALPVETAGQLALPGLGGAPPSPPQPPPAPPPVEPARFYLVRYPAGDFDGDWNRYLRTADELEMVDLFLPGDGGGQFDGFIIWHTEGAGERSAVAVIAADTLPRVRELAEAIALPLEVRPLDRDCERDYQGDNVLRVGSIVREGEKRWRVEKLAHTLVLRAVDGTNVTSVRLYDVSHASDGSGEFVLLPPIEPPTTKARATKAPKPAKKSAPGSKGKPHRMTPVPEADALAIQGTLVATALQADGHWTRWGSNPLKAGGELLTSPEWKKLWGRALTAGLRLRLYNRARRCTLDSLDGDGDES